MVKLINRDNIAQYVSCVILDLNQACSQDVLTGKGKKGGGEVTKGHDVLTLSVSKSFFTGQRLFLDY